MNHNQIVRTVALIALLCSASLGFAKGKHKKAGPPQDRIEVLAHLQLPGGRVEQLLTTRHYRRDYLYAEHASGKTVTLLDVTDAAHPVILSVASLPAGNSTGDELFTVAGNAALVIDSSFPSQPSLPDHTIRILSFADPAHPTIQREFHNVSTVSRDDRGGLIFLASADGLWILQEQWAQDPAEEAQWEHDVLGNR